MGLERVERVQKVGYAIIHIGSGDSDPITPPDIFHLNPGEALIVPNNKPPKKFGESDFKRMLDENGWESPIFVMEEGTGVLSVTERHTKVARIGARSRVRATTITVANRIVHIAWGENASQANRNAYFSFAARRHAIFN